MGWKMVKLGDVARKTKSINPAKFPETVYAHHSIPAFDAGQPAFEAGSEIKSSKIELADGDVLLSKIVPHIARAWAVQAEVNGFKSIGSSEWMVFNDPRFLPDFLTHLFKSQIFRQKFMTTTAGVGGSLTRARPKAVHLIQIPLPPLEEQQRIATILGAVEEARTKQDALVSELSSLEIAVCDAIFSAATEQIRLEETADLQGGLTLSKRRKDNPIEVNYLRVGNVQRRSLELSTVKTIRCKENEIQRCELRKGDVLLVEANANPYEVGRAAQVPEFDTPTVYQNHLFRARPKNDVHPDYLEQAINSMPVRRQLVALARTTSGLNGFSISQARSLKIPLLSQQMQAELADRVSGFRQARVLQEEKAHRLNELYVSLSSRAFAGEL